ncbi:MAG: hypothetical protein Q9172_007233 [Xanthocarpia lactea]
MNAQPYRLTLGKHKNQRLNNIPSQYRDWLINNHVYPNKADLKAALTKRRRFQALAPKKLAISVEENRDNTTPDYSKSAYIFDLGKHPETRLLDVPPEYTAWLIANGVPEKKSALAAALREEGVPAVDISYVFDVARQDPSILSAPKDCYYDSLTATPSWISDKSRLNSLG